MMLRVSARAEPSFMPIFSSSVLGTSIGAFAGMMAMIFSSDPGETSHWVGYGAGIGFLCGFTLGLVTVIPSVSSRSTPGREGDLIFGVMVSFPVAAFSPTRSSTVPFSLACRKEPIRSDPETFLQINGLFQ